MREHERKAHDKREFCCEQCNVNAIGYNSESMKIHIITHHLFDTFELSGELLTALRIHDERHGFVVNDKGSEAHVRKQHRSTVSFNSRNA